MKVNPIVAIGFAALLAALSGVTHAQATSDFNVKLDLASRCFVNIDTTTATSQDTTDVTLSYDAFQKDDEDGSTTFNVRCTKNLGYTISVASDTGTIAGITYYLKLVAGSTAQYASASGSAAITTGLAGTGADQPYTIGVRAAKGQAGDCLTSSCTGGSQSHTITVAY